ncbi:MAG: hypothetical protein M1838_003943 [Thelocarpon superellum]|nr:MAG: hypothetical protein M1838_003943 [Thelocarpon superellum]
MSILSNIRSKVELYRLEKRYTTRRARRSTLQSEAHYIDGEYYYGHNPVIHDDARKGSGGSLGSFGSATLGRRGLRNLLRGI